MTNIRDAKDVQKFVKDKNVSFIQFWFTDVLGKLKTFSVTPSELEEGMAEAWIRRFLDRGLRPHRGERHDRHAGSQDLPADPLAPQRPPVARMFCDIMNPDGTPTWRPRYALRGSSPRSPSRLHLLRGPELEYFYFANDSEAEIIDQAGYFDGLPRPGTDLRARRSSRSRAWHPRGVQPPRGGPSQHEIDLRTSTP